jgi:hypothetical protein
MTNALTQCAYRKSSPSILVMQSTQDRTAQDASRCLGGTYIGASRSGTLLRFRLASAVQGAGFSEARGPW